MAQRSLKAIIAAVITTTLLWMFASSSQPEDCTGEVISLAPCINYITGAASAPSNSCCSQLAAVVRSEPTCFCAVLKGGGPQFGIAGLNRTLALALPAACHVDAPTVGKCNGIEINPRLAVYLQLSILPHTLVAQINSILLQKLHCRRRRRRRRRRRSRHGQMFLLRREAILTAVIPREAL
ncbi:hypothetical protein KSP40_PGU011563 [Platanthera guangdongensis]|uniref:Bifunctional inhibitor/plant lipid transfer protein/seed storage helical domain-containing protein n=1 Tax=Platanthera guangdongensis TaxID=2320717 RepID=A0ABR2LVF1_9ASPA